MFGENPFWGTHINENVHVLINKNWVLDDGKHDSSEITNKILNLLKIKI